MQQWELGHGKEEARSLTQVVSYRGSLRLSKQGMSWAGGVGLVPYLVVWLVAVSYSWQCISLGWRSWQSKAPTVLYSTEKTDLQSMFPNVGSQH